MSVGVMSAGLSNVSATQTYLDIGAGQPGLHLALRRASDPVVLAVRQPGPGWDRDPRRAPSGRRPSIEPGLLASTLQDARRPGPGRADAAGTPGADRGQPGGRGRPDVAASALPGGACPGLAASRRDPGPARQARRAAPGRRPPDRDRAAAAARSATRSRSGSPGEGFGDGNLTSDTTRTDGFVLATDIAPTILDRYGLAIPDEMSGGPIRAEGERRRRRGRRAGRADAGGRRPARVGDPRQPDDLGRRWRCSPPCSAAAASRRSPSRCSASRPSTCRCCSSSAPPPTRTSSPSG